MINSIFYAKDGNSVTIEPGDDIQAKYDWLKSGDRDADMGALSDTNRRTLFLSPGTYPVTTQIDWDTSYVDISGTSGNPRDAMLIGAISGSSLVVQTCDTLNMSSFSFMVTEGGAYGGFWIRGCDNTLSEYRNMVFDSNHANVVGGGICGAVYKTNFMGTWIDCLGTDGAFDLAGNEQQTITVSAMSVQPLAGDTITQAVSGAVMTVVSATSTTITGDVIDAHDWDTANTFTSDDAGANTMTPASNTPTASEGKTIFGATMIDCHSFNRVSKILGTGSGSFVGDGVSTGSTTNGAGSMGTITKGVFISCSSGDSSFNGCIGFTGPIHEDARFYDCHGGNGCFGLSTTVAGEFYNCTCASNGFAGGVFDGEISVFSGKAVNCRVGYDSGSGGGNAAFGSGDKTGSMCIGTLDNCYIEQVDKSLNVKSGTYINNSYIKVEGTNGSCITLITDSGAVIYGSTLIATVAGTGASITDGFAVKTCVSAHNRMNKAFGGLAASSVTVPYDVIDTAIV